MATRAREHELLKLQSEVTNEIGRDAPAIARMVFGDNADHPDMAQLPNDRLDQVYRDAYASGNREWLQNEARRDPEQFLKVVGRIGVRMPTVAPGMPTPPAPGAFAKTVTQQPPPALAPPAPMAPSMPPVAAAIAPVAASSAPAMPLAPAPQPPVILGPNGQPLPPSGVV